MVKAIVKDVRPVLLTGFAGFVGPHVAEALIADGMSVVAVVRRRTAECDAAARRQGIDLVVGDLADGDFLTGLKTHPSSIVHLAANSGRRGEPFDVLHRDNVLSTAQLLHFAKRRGCDKFIHVSSVSIHGRVDISPLGTSQTSHSPTPYGKTKLIAERYLQGSGHGMDIVALRLPGILGPNAPQHLMSSLIKKALAGNEITLHHAASLFNNVVHVADLSRFIVKLATQGRDAGFDAFPLASRDPILMRDVFDLIKLVTGSHSSLREVPSSEANFFIDDSHARSVFGYTSMTTREAIVHFVDPSSAPLQAPC